MSFENYNDVLGYRPITINQVYANQDIIFYNYLGVFPNTSIRLKSPFRPDNTPGCRFEYYDGLWWFIENKGFRDKIAFNCVN